MLEDFEGAFWTYSGFRYAMEPGTLRCVIVGVDPSGVGEQGGAGDAIGIVVCSGRPDKTYVALEDTSTKDGPEQWALRVAGAYHDWQADKIFAERNFGGAMVSALIKSLDPSWPLQEVVASRGKHIQKEPIAAFCSQGRVTHL